MRPSDLLDEIVKALGALALAAVFVLCLAVLYENARQSHNRLQEQLRSTECSRGTATVLDGRVVCVWEVGSD